MLDTGKIIQEDGRKNLPKMMQSFCASIMGEKTSEPPGIDQQLTRMSIISLR